MHIKQLNMYEREEGCEDTVARPVTAATGTLVGTAELRTRSRAVFSCTCLACLQRQNNKGDFIFFTT